MRVIFAKTASSSARNQKTFWKRICVRKILHKFFLCTPNLWFWHPWLTFLSEQKKTHKVLNNAESVKFTFIIFFLEMLHWTIEMRLWQPWEIIFAGKPMCSFNDRRLSFKQFCFQKNLWKCSSAHVGYGFENHALQFYWKSKFFLLKVQNWLKKQKFQVNFPNCFLSLRWSVVWHTWLNNFAKRQRNHWNPKDDNRKRKHLRKRNLFSSKYFSGSANFCWLNHEKNFLTERPIFFISKSEEGWNHVQF